VYKNIIFDADGTLLDTLPGIYAGFNLVMERFNRPPLSHEDVKPFMGPALVETFSMRLGFSAKDTKKAVALYRDFYGDGGYAMCDFYPGIPELLDKLKSAGKILCVATNKPQVFIDRILREKGYFDRFAVVAGPDLSEKTSDKATLVRRAICDKAAVMVGDRYIDILVADACGIDSIGVLWGAAPEGEFDKYRPTHRVKDCGEVYDLVISDK